jgi:dTDP-glucose 4,6-dehydratase
VIEVDRLALGDRLRGAAEDDPQVRQPDISLANDVLGWSPEVELKEGLKRTIEEAGVERLVGA